MKERLLSYVNFFANFGLFGTHYEFWYGVFSFTRIFRVMEKRLFDKTFGFTKFLSWKKLRKKQEFIRAFEIFREINSLKFISEKSFSRNFYRKSIVKCKFP